MELYWYELFNNPTQASIIGKLLASQFEEAEKKKYKYAIYATRRKKYGIKFKIAIS